MPYASWVAERLMASALADLGDSLSELRERRCGARDAADVVAPDVVPDRLDAMFFGEGAEVVCVPANARALDIRWGELLYDLASSALAPWADTWDEAGAILVGVLRPSADEAHVIVHRHAVHIFEFPYDSWPSGIHMGAWESILGGLAEADPAVRVHRWADAGWRCRRG